MNWNNADHRILKRRERLVAFALAVTTGVVAFAGLLAVFDGASPRHWLSPEPQLLAKVGDCERMTARAERQRCKQQVVEAQLQSHERQATRLAEGAQPSLQAAAAPAPATD